jgi:hypothetical protein
MLSALAVLLRQPQVHALMAFSAGKIALIQRANSSPASSSSFIEDYLPLMPISSDISIQPAAVSDSPELPNALAAETKKQLRRKT